MNILKYKISDSDSPKSINLGKAGEYGVTKFVFDFSAWRQKYGEGYVTMLHTLPKLDASNPIIFDTIGNNIEWVVSAADTIYPGNGKLEIRYYTAKGLKKSITIKTVISVSPFNIGDPTEEEKNWIHNAEKVVADSQKAIRDIPNKIEEALQEAKDSGAFKGDPGYTPVEGVDYFTDAEKEQMIEDVSTGVKGSFGAFYNESVDSFNANVMQKEREFDDHISIAEADLDSRLAYRARTLEGEISRTASDKIEEYNQNADKKTKAFNENASYVQGLFNHNASSQLNEFNDNYLEKLGTFNGNATNQFTEFNQNAGKKQFDFNLSVALARGDIESLANEKKQEYNQNAEEKIAEYDAHVHDFEGEISQLSESIVENFAQTESIKTNGNIGLYRKENIQISTRSQYLDVDGVATLNTSFGSWCSSVIDTSLGDSFKVTVRSQVTGKYGYMFVDDANRIISKGLEGLDDSGTLTVRTDEVIITPNGATKLILNSCESSGTIISAKKYAFENTELEVLKKEVLAWNAYDGEILNGYYVNNSNQYYPNSSYYSYYVPCSIGEKYKVTTQIRDSIVNIVQFYDESGTFISGIPNGGGLPKTVTDYEFNVPESATYLSVTSYQTKVKLSKYGMRNDYEYHPLMYVHRRNALVEINWKWSEDKDAIFIINKVGPNDIEQIAGFYTVENTEKYPCGDFDKQRTSLRNAGSDWMSPYKVFAKNNADGDGASKGADGYYTGGFHSYNNTQSGVATGRTSDIKVYLDGVELTQTSDSVKSVDKDVVVKVTNLIQGNNTTKADGTGREILKEEITYTITPNRVDVSNTITALEDLTISQYYGLQVYAFSTMNHFSYYGDSVEEHDFSSNTEYRKDIDFITCGIPSEGACMVCELEKVGLGRHFLIKDGGLYARSIIGRKVYNSLVDNANHLPLSANESVFIKGNYRFADGRIPF